MKTFLVTFGLIFVAIPMFVMLLYQVALIRTTYLKTELVIIVILIIVLGFILKKRK